MKANGELRSDRWRSLVRKYFQHPLMLILTLASLALTLYITSHRCPLVVEDLAVVLWVIMFFFYSDRLLYLLLSPPGLEKLRHRLSCFLNENPLFIWSIISVIIFSLVLIIIENVFPLDSRMAAIIRIGDDAILLIFLLEFYFRYISAGEDKLSFLSRSDSIIDIMALFPLLRVFRLMRFVRLLRFLRVAKLKKYFVALSDSMASLATIWSENVFSFMIIFLLAVVFLVFGTLTIYHIERSHPTTVHGIGDALWWSVALIFSGQPIDISGAPSRVLGGLLILSGVIITSLLTGTVAATLSDRLRSMRRGSNSHYSFREHIIICGWRNEAIELVRYLQQHMGKRRKQIVIIDDVLDEMPPMGRDVYFIKGSPLNEQILMRGNLPHANAVIILSTGGTGPYSEQKTILATLAAESLSRKKANRDIHTCTELVDSSNIKSLQRAYVNEMILIDEFSRDIIAQSALFPGLIDFFNELLTNEKAENNIYKIMGYNYVGKTFGALFLELSEKNIIPVGVLREEIQTDGDGAPLVDEMGTLEIESRIVVNPPGDDYVITQYDRIFVIAKPEDIKRQEVTRD